jgi:NADH-quinone oxidoreductase subunit F
MGSEKSPGTRLFCVSGQVQKPGVYELPMGTPVREIIDKWGGGVRPGRKIKAVTPGGISAPILMPEQLDVPCDFDNLAKLGTMGGSGGLIVYDDTTCMVRTLARVARFFAHESCGQCTPCREGTDWAYKIIARIEKGQATIADIDKASGIAKNMAGITVCVLSDAAAGPIVSFIKNFRAEFEQHVTEKRCPFPA